MAGPLPDLNAAFPVLAVASLGKVVRRTIGNARDFAQFAVKQFSAPGSFICTNQYCTRYMVGIRGKGEVNTGTNHVGFRCALAP
jgi:formylglycine-generating enzyme required for sulfatase activity